MSASTCLYRRPSGIYVVRIAVPKRLRFHVGKNEIHASTGARDLNAAKIAALSIQLHWRQQFMALDPQKLSNPSPLLAGEGFVSIGVAADSIGLSVAELLGEMRNARCWLFAPAAKWRGWHVPDLSDIDREDGQFVLNDVEAKGAQVVCNDVMRLYSSSATIARLLDSGESEEELFRTQQGQGGFFPLEPVQLSVAAMLAQKAPIEAIRARLVAHLPAPAENAPEVRQTLATAQESNPEEVTPVTDSLQMIVAGWVKHANMRFSELYEHFRDSNKWGTSQTGKMKKEAGLFIELMNNPRLRDIDYPMILNYAKELERLPSDIYQSRRNAQTKHATVRELIAIAEAKNLPRKEEATVKNHVSRLSEILKWAAGGSNYIEKNPASAYKRGWNTTRTRMQDERDLFSKDELGLIFSQDWFKKGTGEFFKSGFTQWRPHYYWLPILALSTGARLNELSQLYLGDVVRSENGIWYLDFNLAETDKANLDGQDEPGDDKSLKTVNAIRTVPLADCVIDLGLPEYLVALRQAGHRRLFPELKRDEEKGYGKPAGSWFNERFLGDRLGIERNGRKVFHSFRHTFLTAADKCGLDERELAQIAGHIRGKTQSGMRYVKDREAEELKPTIERIITTRPEFKVLDSIGKFVAEDGLRAIRNALRRKKA